MSEINDADRTQHADTQIGFEKLAVYHPFVRGEKTSSSEFEVVQNSGPIKGTANKERNDEYFKKQVEKILHDPNLQSADKLKQLDDRAAASVIFYLSDWASSAAVRYTHEANIKALLDLEVGQSEGQDKERNKLRAAALTSQMAKIKD